MDYIDANMSMGIDPSSDVTITVLPVSLSLVHIPRDRLSHFCHPIIKLILLANPAFLNISCNDTEVSIIAQQEDVRSFVRIAEKDARRVGRRRRSAAARNVREAPGTTKPSSKREHKSVEISSCWSALQIDSHGDELGDASARIREISALLSGISILYQSSCTTDYIFVQAKLLPEVLSILSNANYLSLASIPSDLSSQISSLVSSSSDPSTRSSSPLPEDIVDVLLGMGIGGGGEAKVKSRRGTASSHASLHSLLLAKSARVSMHIQDLSPVPQDILPPIPPPKSPVWQAQDMPTPTPTPAPPAFSPTSTSTVATDVPRRKREPLSPYTPDVTILPTDLVVVGLNEDLVEAWSMKLIKLLLFRETMFAASSVGEHVNAAERGRERRRASTSDESMWGFAGDAGEDVDDNGAGTSDSSLSDNDHALSDGSSSSEESFHSAETSPSRSASPSSNSRHRFPPLPFFSLTRTADGGTSLTTDAGLLAALYPPREMVFCTDEVFSHLDHSSPSGDSFDNGNNHAHFSLGGQKGGEGVFFKCLHVNLENYGLDRHGLVNRFSDVLHSNNIHHLYCSTFKTANLLVDERDAVRAQALLRDC